MARRVLRQQTNFLSGELSPVLMGRTDLVRYLNGCKELLNWLPLVQGGVRRAPGTLYVAETFGATRLEGFEFSLEETFLFAFRDGVLDIYKDDALHQSLTTPWTTAILWELDYTQALDTVLVTHEDHATRRIYRGPSDVFAIEDLSDTALAIHLTGIPQEDAADVWSVSAGWPRAVTFHENRLVLGGSKSYPNRFWASKSGEYFDFTVGSNADDAIAIELLSDQFEAIQWVESMRRLVIGTSSAEWATIQDAFITPDFCNLKRQSAIGSKRVSPVSMDGAVLHVTRTGDQVRELLYTDVEQAFATASLSLLSPLAVAGAKQLAAKTAISYDDANLVFVVNTDGTLGVLNTLRDQEVLAWARRTFAGTVESVATLGEEIYLVVAYAYGPGVFDEGVFESGVFEESGGSSNRYLVKWDEATYTDFAKTVTSATELTVWPGFDHLAGSTVQVLLDGQYEGDFVVAADGTITTETAGLTLTAGVAIPTPTLIPLPPAFDGVRGSVALQARRLVRAHLQLLDTSALRINGDAIPFRASDFTMGAIASFTGVKEVRLTGWSREPTVTITAPDPLPVTILSLALEVAY